MLKVENLSYGFTDKDLYTNVSFSIEAKEHAVLIGSNGTGKTTLIHILMHPEDYLYDGKIHRAPYLRIGYVSQFIQHDKELHMTVYDYLAKPFVDQLALQDELCLAMGDPDQYETAYEQYQQCLDAFEAIDGYNYDGNIRKELKLAGLHHITDVAIDQVSGGEFKLLQVIKEMLQCPDLMIMDEPDVFLDFENLNGLRDLINSYKNSMLVITHNRYLLNHCFNKVLHLENADMHEYEGSYMAYNLNLLQLKIEMMEAAEKMNAWIAIQEQVVENLRADATRNSSPNKGRFLKGRVTYLERLKATRTKEPFVDLRQPDIRLPELENEENEVNEALAMIAVKDYSVAFSEELLKDVCFEIHRGEKVALVGANGTGKTTLLRAIWHACQQTETPAIQIADSVDAAFLSQLHSETLKEAESLAASMEDYGLFKREEIEAYLSTYCFDANALDQKIQVLSGGEKNLLQLAQIARTKANLLLLDEPTSHLDTWSQITLEKALAQYQGTVLMVSHDFYTIADCTDYVLYVEEGTIRRMSSRAFRKMIYKHHFSKDYLELENQKKNLELKVESLLQKKNYQEARRVCDELEDIIGRMQ